MLLRASVQQEYKVQHKESKTSITIARKDQIKRRIHRGARDARSHCILFDLGRRVPAGLADAPLKFWAHLFLRLFNPSLCD